MKRYDDIDQLFRNRLGVEDQESSDWLTPPQFILDNAAQVINERRKKRRRGFIILFFGILLTAFFAIQFMGLKRGNGDKPEASYSAIQVHPELTNSKARLEASTIKLDNQGSDYSRNPDMASSGLIQEKSRNPDKANKRVLNSRESFKNKEAVFNSLAVLADTEKEGRSSNLNDDENPVSEPRGQKLEQIKNIAYLEVSKLTWERPLILNEQKLTEIKSLEDPRVLLFYAFAGTNLSTLQMSNVAPADFELTEYDNFYFGYQLGFGAEYRPGKSFSITGSVSFNSFLNKSAYTSKELYDKANEEIETDGSISYKASFDISTPLSETSKDFIIDVDDYSVQQDHILVNSTEIRERINVLKTTLGLSYKFASIDRVSIALNGGLSANSVFRLNNHYKSTVLYENKKMMEAEFKSDERAMLKNFFLSSHVSVEGDYKINTQWSAIFNAGYERSIGSIRKQGASDPTQTMLGSISLNVGLRHLF